MNLAFVIKAAADPLGTTLLTLTQEDLEAGSSFRAELYGLGSGRIVINRNRPECTAANFAQDNFVQVFDLDLSAAISLGGFFLDDEQVQVLSLDEEGGEALAFGGPGALSYFGRAMLDQTNYVHFGNDAEFGPHDDGQWYWYDDQYGDILKRMIDEAQDPDRPQTPGPIPDLTYDFDSTDDSASAPWDTFSGAYSLPIGTNYLDIIQRFRDLGITVQVRGELLLQAFQGFYGVDRTTAVFAASKVRFVNVDGAAGANIVQELARHSKPSLQLSRVLVKGDVETPSLMVSRTAGAYNVVREGFAQTADSHAVEVLNAIGDQAIQLRSDSSDVPVFKHIPGLNALSGLYTPFPGGQVSTDRLLNLARAAIKVTSESTTAAYKKEKAVDGSDSTHWSGHASSGPPVAASYWAGDLGSSKSARYWRMRTDNPADAPQNIATEVRVYGSDSGAAWTWLPAGHLTADPASNGWTLLDTYTQALTSPLETGLRDFGSTQTYRYWLFRAVTGGSDEWDINSVELRTPGVVSTDTYWVGDLVTLHTGSEIGDYTEAALRVYAINWQMDEQGNWWPIPELGGLIQAPSPRVAAPASLSGGGGGGGVVSVSSPPPSLVKRILTNKSGGAVVRGDVVVIDPDNDEAFETTTTAGETRQVGIAQEDIANNAAGYVATHGYVELVTVAASVTRGHYGSTSTTVKKASGAAARAAGAFCEFLKGGTTPSAILFGPPDAAMSWKRPVRAATTAAGTLATSFENGDTVDGVVLATGDRILIKDQVGGAANGIYIVAASGAPARAEDFKASAEALGAAMFVSEGTTNGNKIFVCTTNAPITLETTALVFADASGGGGVTDHGALTGLGDDDHTQYATNTEFDDHNARHETGGADAIKLDDLAAADDNTDLNASTTKHGLVLKGDNNPAHFLRGDHSWATIAGSAGAEAWEDVVADLSGKVHRWKFEEASGGSVNDEISTLDLTLTGSVAYSVASPLGNGVSFTGGYGETSGLGSIPVGDAVRTVIAVWKQTTQAVISANFPIFSYGANLTRQLFQIFTSVTAGMTLTLGTDTVAALIPVGDGNWHLSAGVHSGTRSTSYYQDSQVFAMTAGGTMATSSVNNFHVAAEFDDTDPCLITVTDVIVFDRGLNKAELDRLWHALRVLLDGS